MQAKISIDQIGKHIAPAIFIGSSSFETRCSTILKSIVGHCEKIILFKNKQKSDLAGANYREMCAIAGGKVLSTDLDIDSPVATADALIKAIQVIPDSETRPILVDITTFTHEQLLILLRIFNSNKSKQKIVLCYTGADQYSTNTSPDQVWLSEGVSQIRSVIGFPGQFLPSRNLHLVLLVGFEFERAKTVIERFEPAAISLGIGGKLQSISEMHHETNKRFFEKLTQFIGLESCIYSNVSHFEFSCVDPVVTKNALLEVVQKNSTLNTVVCPMNTKLSTVGVGLAALEDHRIQLCYSRAISYNEEGYSSPSATATLFELNF